MSQNEPSNEIVKAAHAPGTEMAETFSGKTAMRTAETASSAVMAQARAAIEARYVMALQRPRDMDAARLAILKECKRPGFASVARYRKPIGEGITGPSIRFAETAIRLMGNISIESAAIYDDADKRIMRVTVTDLESNVPYSGDVTIEKTKETLKLKEGQIPISVRTNSVGAKTYLVVALEDDLLNKQGALVSKQLRTLALRLIPGDIIEEAMTQVIETNEKDDAVDPDAARKKIIGGFDKLGVKPSDLRDYLGHELDKMSPAEMDELRGVGSAIRDGEATWKDSLEFKLKKAGAPVDGSKPETLKDKVAREAAKAVQAKVDAKEAKGKTAHDADGVVIEKAQGAIDKAVADIAQQRLDVKRQPGDD